MPTTSSVKKQPCTVMIKDVLWEGRDTGDITLWPKIEEKTDEYIQK